MQGLRKKRKKQTGENMDIINKRYMHGELAPDTPKAPNEPMAIDPNAKVMQGAMSGDGNDKKGKSKSKVDPAIFRICLLYTSPSPRDVEESRMPSSA